MDLNDLSKEIERMGMPLRPRARKPDFNVRHGKLKALILRGLAILLLAIVAAFGLLIVSHYRSPLMSLLVIVYLCVGAFLSYKLFTLTYTGWLYTLFLAATGVLMPVLALISRGTSNSTLTMGAIAVLATSLCSAALLLWARDLFGIKGYKDVFMPYA